MMQNHYVISSKYHFWTRNVRNWTKSPDLVMSGPVQEDPYGPHMGPYAPILAHMDPQTSDSFLPLVRKDFPCVFLNLWNQEEVRTWRKSEFWSNLARFRSTNGILTKWPNDSASFLLEKLKNQVILIKNLNIWPKTLKSDPKIENRTTI